MLLERGRGIAGFDDPILVDEGRQHFAPTGIVALRLDRDHKVIATEHFSTVAGGTGLRIYKDALYAASPTTVYRFAFQGPALVPADPEIMIDGMPANGFPSRGLAFDGKGSPVGLHRYELRRASEGP